MYIVHTPHLNRALLISSLDFGIMSICTGSCHEESGSFTGASFKCQVTISSSYASRSNLLYVCSLKQTCVISFTKIENFWCASATDSIREKSDNRTSHFFCVPSHTTSMQVFSMKTVYTKPESDRYSVCCWHDSSTNGQRSCTQLKEKLLWWDTCT